MPVSKRTLDLFDLRWGAVHKLSKALHWSEENSFAGVFATTLGFVDWWDLVNALEEGNQDLYEKLQMLNSPHALTIYRAMQARK